MKFLPPNTTSKLQPCDQGIIQSLKVHYRHQLVKKLLFSIEAGKELKVSVLDAMQWLKVAWDNVTIETIQNCFQHCSFSGLNSPSTDMNASRVPCSELESLFEELKSYDIDVQGSVEEYTGIDNYVAIDGIPTDSEIASLVQDDTKFEELCIECDDEPVVCPTISEFRNALDVVRRYMTCHTYNTHHLNAITELEDFLLNTSTIVRQSSLSDYYSAKH